MAANDLKYNYSSTTTTVISLAATLANAANTYSTMTNLTMTPLDNSTDDYPYARAVLEIVDTFAAAPTAGSVISLWMTRNNIDGASDTTPVPAASDIDNIAEYVGAWVMDDQDVAVRKEIIINLEGVTNADFYIKNECGQQISYSANPTTVKITPFTVAPT